MDVELLNRVFKVLITTIRCIPYGCRLTFAQELITVLYKVVVQPRFMVRLLHFSRCTL